MRTKLQYDGKRLSMVKVYNFFDENAHLNEETLALYVDALKLHKVYLLPGAVLGHVDDCQKCKSDILEALPFVVERVDSVREPHPYFCQNANSMPARFSLPYRIAAIFFVGIGIGILFYLFRYMREGQGIKTDSIQSVQVIRPEFRKSPAKDSKVNHSRIFADNFSESPNLENLVNSASRSELPLIVSPKNNAVVSQKILFEWKMQEVGLVSVTILSNREEVLKNIRLKQSKFLFSVKLNPGLYYWKLQRKDELLYVGEFFVK